MAQTATAPPAQKSSSKLVPPSHAQIKGTGLGVVAPYVRARWGEPGLVTLGSYVRSKGAIDVIEGRTLAGSWYSFATFVELLDAGEEIFGPAFAAGQGKYAADTNLSGVYRAFIRLASPGFLIERASKVWRQYYSSGEMLAVKRANAVRAELRGFSTPHRGQCQTVVGWSVRAIELTGAHNVKGAHPSCRARGDLRCVFTYDWD